MPPTPVFALTGHTALITGSARGLGLEMARGLAAAGARVVLNGRDPVRLGQAAQLLADEGLKTVTCPFDVTDADATTAALESLLKVSGPVDILVNNVGQRDRRGLDAVTSADLARMVDTHVISAYRISRYVAQDLRPTPRWPPTPCGRNGCGCAPRSAAGAAPRRSPAPPCSWPAPPPPTSPARSSRSTAA
jgi:gluconate 5-dehydrogenase